MRQVEEVEAGRGNVFADLGLPDAEERYAKAMLSRVIARELDARAMTRAEAAKRLGTTQAKISGVVRGELAGFSMERLFRFLTALGMDVRVEVRPSTPGKCGRLQVAAG
jgi:predicted XRE-type DNA-binding protein